MTMKTILKKLLNVKYIIIKKVELLEEIATLKVYVGMTKGKRGRCPICNRKCPYYDTVSTNREWKSIDFGPFKVLIVAHTRRVCCSEHGIHTEAVPWAYHNSRFTKDFEQYASYLALHLNKTEAAKLLRISWNTIGPILSRTKKRMEPDMNSRFEGVTRIGIDETSYRKGHKYVTVVLDHDKNQVIWVGKGTGIEVLTQFFECLTQEQRENITLVSADGAKWIKSTVEEYLPHAEFCIDGFHVISWAIDAMDELRKKLWHEAKAADKTKAKRGKGRPKKGEEVEKKTSAKFGKSMKYALGKNPENLSEKQQSCLDEIRELYPKLFRGYQLKEGLRAVFRCDKDKVEDELNNWLSWACRSKLEPFVDLSQKIRRHKEAIIATVKHGLSNARIESTNNKIKVLIRKAYGFRNIENLIDMILIVCSDLYHRIQLPYETRLSTHTN